MNSKEKPAYILIIYLFIWTVLNMTFLVSFPFMHTDESWLAGLSRAMLIRQNPAATEPFFNLLNRAPHAIKILFHCCQVLFIKLFGYSLFSIRLLQLLTGLAALAVFGRLLSRLKLPPLPGVIMLSVQIQFIYASHFGRQEIQLLLLMLLSLNILWSSKQGFHRGLLAGLPAAAAIGFHPNAFITAWPAGLLLLSGIISRRRSPREGIGFLIPPALSAAFFLLLSFQFNSGFVEDYSSFGREVGVFEAFDIKLLSFDDFYRKLLLRISGTYYTPRIWPVFIAGAAGLIILTARSIISRKPFPAAVHTAAAGIVGVNAGILLVGKYSAPSVVFLMPFLVLPVLQAIELLPAGGKKLNAQKIAAAAAVAALLVNSVLNIREEVCGGESFAEYSRRIQNTIPETGGRVLGPLTAEFSIQNGRLLDWRNLTALRDAGMSVEEYIETSGIEFIIYNEEYDLIYKNRPVWNVLYGNPTIYHEQLQKLLAERGELIAEFASPGYGTRIVLHREKKDWMVRVYRVSPPR